MEPYRDGVGGKLKIVSEARRRIGFIILIVACLFVSGGTAVAQSTPSGTVGFSSQLNLNIGLLPKKDSITRENRARALSLISAAQRNIVQMRTRNQSVFTANANAARDQLFESARLNPWNPEVYTVLAELAQMTLPYDYSEPEKLARFALSLEPNGPGANRILARILVIRSELTSSLFNEQVAREAIIYLKKITEFDSRNAEAWALLSELYNRLGLPEERLKALEGWVASANPLDYGFYEALMGQGADLSPESASLSLAEAYLDRGMIREALERLNAVINNDPNDAEALELLQEALEISDSASAKSAVIILEQALFANPGNVALAVALSRVLYRNNRIAEGSRVLDKLIEESGRGSERELRLRIFQADLFSEVADYQRAIDILLGILGKDPGGISRDYENLESMVKQEVFRKLLLIEKATGRMEGIERLLSAYRWVFPATDSFSEEERVRVLIERGEFRDAGRELSTIRKRFPDKDFSVLESSILVRQGKPDEAIAVFNAAENRKPLQERRPEFTARITVASLLMDAGAGDRTVSFVENASQFARNDEERFVAKLVLASAQRRNGNLTRAVALVEEALLMSPENPMAMNNLGFMLLESGGDIERAIGLIRKAVRIDPRNSAYLDSLGLAYIKRGNPDLALEKLRRALVLNPVSVAILEHLGDAHLAKGEKGKAVEFWKRASMIAWDRLVKERLKGKIDNSAR